MFTREKHCKNNQAINHPSILISSNKYHHRTQQIKKINVIDFGKKNPLTYIGAKKKMIKIIQIIIFPKNITTIKKNFLNIKKNYQKVN